MVLLRPRCGHLRLRVHRGGPRGETEPVQAQPTHQRNPPGKEEARPESHGAQHSQLCNQVRRTTAGGQG